ncbi:hypothetical protein PAXRUDRAFT_13454 [Paxillus rubicundulus Ve08.2h10]|uniref:Stress-response A/B barrel domain-containing protein n=1 Tax=Paxillus rubicundulus Ve08.2h10 TaxID=930991 RepID=A0A0D0D5S3_9AGAM|nr:hypothetical protein PAXRUDRAFT_13454 [Paxillus rubicundulus Ve08.2h10]
MSIELVQIVLLKFKQGVSPEDIDKFRHNLHSLGSKIPAISAVKAGRVIRHPLDHGFDEGVIFVFKDEAALKNDYIPHQAHRDYQAFSEPYIEDKLIFDIYSDE